MTEPVSPMKLQRRDHPPRDRADGTAQWARLFILFSLLVWASTVLIGFRTGLAVLTLAAVGALLMGLSYPVISLYGLAMLCTLDPMIRVFLMKGGLLPWNFLNYLLLMITFLGAPFLLRAPSGQLRLLQGLVLLLGVGLLFSPDLVRGTQDLLSLTAVFGLLLCFIRASGYRGMWYGLALVSGTISAAACFAFLMFSSQLSDIDPNAWSYVPLTAILTACLALSVTVRQTRRQIALIALALVNCGWVFASGSRGTMVVTAGCLIFLLTMVQGVRVRIAALAVAAMVILGVSSQFSERGSIARHRVAKLFDTSHTWASRTSQRSTLVLGGFEIFREHPVIGVGTGGFISAWEASPDVYRVSGARTASGKLSHTAWIKVLAENGIIGGLLFAGYVCSFAVLGWRSHEPRIRALGLLTTFALGSAFLSTEFQGKGTWFLAAGAFVLLHPQLVATYSRADQRVASLRSVGRAKPRKPAPQIG
jgi:O-antigen ligase/polysaccharide polymerase Wzy-like membrane protein